MNLQEAQSTLKAVVDSSKKEVDVEQSRRDLEDCLAVLHRETRFQPVPPGSPTPILRYELVQAETLIEQALKGLEENDVPAMLQHVQEALSLITSAVSAKTRDA
jgi:hypothetical protein